MLRTPNAREEAVAVSGSSTFGVSPKISAAQTWNMFETDGWLVSFAGYRRVLQLFESGQGRGIYASARGQFMIVVINSKVYRISKTFNAIEIGTLNTSTGPVSIDENLNSQICIVDGKKAYIYYWQDPPNLTIQTGGVLGSGALQPNYVTYHNTYFLFGNANRTATGAKWYAYQPNTGDNTLIDEVSDLTFQVKTDYPLGVKRIPNQASNVLVFGYDHCEVFQQVGGLDNYLRNNSVSVDSGVASMSAVDSDSDYIMWIGSNEKNAPVLLMFTGQGAKRISTDGIDRVFAEIKEPEKVVAYFYRQFGHLFFCFTFYGSQDNVSYAYDVDNDAFYNLSDHELNHFPAREMVYFNKKYYFVSLNNGSIYEYSHELDTYDENITDAAGSTWNCGDPFPDPTIDFEIQRIRITNTVRAPRSTRFRVNQFTMWIEQGVQVIDDIDECQIIMITEEGVPIITEEGVQVVPEEDREDDCEVNVYQPAIDCAISIDGNRSWSSYVRRYLNPTGKRRNILMWNQLGACNEMTFKLRIWSKGPVCLTDGVADLLP